MLGLGCSTWDLPSSLQLTGMTQKQETGNWMLRKFIAWAPDLLSGWPPLCRPLLCFADDRNHQKEAREGIQSAPVMSRSPTLRLQCFALFALLTLKSGGVASWMMDWPHQYLCWAQEYSQNSAWHVAQWIFAEWMNTYSLISIQLLDTRLHGILL